MTTRDAAGFAAAAAVLGGSLAAVLAIAVVTGLAASAMSLVTSVRRNNKRGEA